MLRGGVFIHNPRHGASEENEIIQMFMQNQHHDSDIDTFVLVNDNITKFSHFYHYIETSEKSLNVIASEAKQSYKLLIIKEIAAALRASQ